MSLLTKQIFQAMKIFKSKSNHGTTRRFKTNHRFRLAFINENTFNQVWTIKMTQTRVILSVLLLIAAIGCIVTTLIVFTPIRTLLPGYLKSSQLQENIANSLRIDSLTTEARISNAYIANISRILSGDADSTIIANSIASDSAAVLPIDSIVGASEAEKQFVRQFEAKEKFNLSVLSPIAAEGLSFYPPVSAASISDNNANTLGINLIASRNAPISSIYNGTVVDCYYNSDTGYTIIVQHPNGFLSKYSGLGETFVEKGDKVSSGKRIGLSGKKSYYGATLPIVFELWHKGTPLNPRDYFTF